MDEEILNRLYQNASKAFDLPDFETFKVDMQDEAKLSRFRESMISKNFDIPDLETFKSDIGFGLGIEEREDKEVILETKIAKVPEEIIEEKKGPVEEINNLEVELAELKSKKETIKPGQEKYDLGMSIKRLESQISKAKSEIDYGDRSFENSLSLVGATEEEFQSIMSANNIPVKQAGIGTGNAIKYVDPKTNEEVYIDLQPFTYDEKIKSSKQIDQLKNSFKSLSNEELSNNIASRVGLMDNVYSMNDALDGTNYSVKESFKPGSAVLGFKGTPVYQVYEGKDLVGSYENQNDLSAYFNKNLDDQDVNIINDNSVKASSKLAESRKDRLEIEKVKLDNIEVNREFVEGKEFGERIFQVLSNKNSGFTKEEAEIVKNYINNFDSRRPTETVTSRDIDGFSTRQVPKKLTDEEYIEKVKDLTGLPQEIGVKLYNLDKSMSDPSSKKGFIEQIYEDGLNNFKKNKLDNKMTTIYETLTKESGDQDLLKLSYSFGKAEEKEYKENINKYIEKTSKKVDDLAVRDVKSQLEKISAIAPSGSKINVNTIDSEFIYSIEKPKRKLTKEEEVKFKEAQASLFLLYENQKNNQKDLELEAERLLASIKTFEEKKRGEKISQAELFNVAFKEYGLGSIIKKDFNDATAQLLLAVPTLVNSEWAIEQQRKLNAKEKTFETPLTYDQALEQDQGGRFLLRTGAQQAPNMILAIGTAGAGNALGLSKIATQITVGSQFGVSSGADKYRRLELGTELVETAKNQRKQIQDAYDLGFIDDKKYNNSMLEVNKVIAMNDLTDNQIIGASIATGIIEGTFTSFLGTAPNSLKFIKDFSKGTRTLADYAYASRLAQFGYASKEFGKRVGAEVLEEEGIFFGDQIVSEGLILGRDMDFSQWDDTAVAAIVMSGAMSGPGVAYSAMANNTAGKKLKENIDEINKEIEGFSLAIDTEQEPEIRKILTASMSQKLKDLNSLTNGLEVEMIALGSENQKKLLAFNSVENSILAEADVKPTDSETTKNEKIQIYRDNLIKEGKKNKAEDFDQKLKSINSEKENILKDVKYERVDEALGERGKEIADHFKRYNNQGYNNKSRSEKLAQVIEKIRSEVVEDNIIKAKSNPVIVERVENLKTKAGKPLSNRSKNKEYAKEGENMLYQQGKAISLAVDVESKGKKIVDEIGDLDILFVQDIDEAYDLLQSEKYKDITNEHKKQIIEGLKEDNFGFIVGNKYIVKDTKSAREKLKEGKILQGTMILHEVSHAIDDRIFTTPELKKQYADNVYKYVEGNGVLRVISNAIIESLENQLFTKEKGKKWEDKSEAFKDEYTKSLQEHLYALEDRFKLEKKEGIADKIEAMLGLNLKVDTPQKAFDYMISNNSAFRQGKISKKTQKRISKAPKGVESGIKKSSLGFVVDETPAERKKRQDKRNVDVDKVYQDFAKDKTKEEWNEFLDTRRGDSVFGKMLQDYSIDMYAIAINRRAQDPILATSEAIEPLMNHIRAFDPTKNKDLPGYIGGYLGLKTGTGIQRTTKKIQDISLEQEGVRQVAEKQAEKEIEPQVEEKLRDKKSFVELDILNEKVKKDINSKILSNLYKLAIKGDLSIDQVISKIEETIQKDISKDLISIFGPKSIAQDSKTKEVIISDTYKQALRVNYKNIIKSIPVDVIKKKYNKLFKLKEIGREDIKKVTEEGKVTNYRKAIFDISEPGLDNFINFFTKGGYTTLRARQRSMVDNIAKELAAVSLFSLNIKENSLSDLFEGSDTETKEKVVEFVFKNASKNIKNFLTREVGEQRSMDIVKFSADLTIPQINSFANSTSLIIEEYKKIAKPNKQGEYKPTEAQLLKALTYSLIINEDKAFSGPKGLEAINSLVKSLRLPLQNMLKNLPKLKNIDQAEFLIRGVEQEIAGINLQKVLEDSGVKLGKKFSWADLNRNSDHLIRMKDIGFDANKDYYTKAKNKKQALIDIWKWDPNHQATAGSSFIKRSQFYPNKKEYVNYDFNQIDPENVKIIYKDKKSFEIERVEIFEETISGKEWNETTRVPAQEAIKTVTKNGVKSKVAIPKSKFEEEYNERQGAALSAWNFMNAKLDYLSKNASKLETASYLYTLAQASMTTMLKAAAPVEYYYVGPSFSAQLRYEHMLPTNYVVTELGKKYVKNEDIDLEKLRKQYKVAIIPIIMDDNINYLLQDYMPASYTLDMDSDARYYNNTHLGMDNMFPIKSLDPNKQKELPVGQDWVDVNNAYIAAKESTIEDFPRSIKPSSDITINTSEVIGYAKTVDEALKVARDPNAPIKKIRVFDFDDTLATTKSDVLFTSPDGTEGKLNAEEFAKQGAQLLEEGYVFDFSEFNKVTKGKPGPLLDIAKKIQAARGTEDIFVLTARAPEAQIAIKEFLDSVGLNIPLENITGLGNSTGEAKANWMVEKAAEGYNDFYFADDAYQNVKAVKDAMSVLDVKSKVQQAKIKFSKSVNEDFNKIIEQTTGIASEKRYSKAKAKVRGANKGNKKFFIPYSAEDFMGLIYPLLSKGKLGDSQMAWFKKNLLDPYAMANENLSTDRLQLMEDFKTLKKALDVPKDLRKKTDSGFTKEQAIRVYLFNKAGFDVPGISKTDLNELLDLVNSDGVLKAFGDQIFNLTKGDGYAKPSDTWLVGTITTDLIDVLNKVKRVKYLDQSGYTANADLIFSEENLNKLEAAYGSKYREAIENVLGRMKSGKNRIFSGNRLSNRVLDYINNSTGAIMFFNTRSAVLQTISAVNFLNWSFNNPYKAGKAFANQKQYWKDFVELINSDYLMDRRNGLKLNINESEIADAAATSKNKAKAAINYILQKGFLPTQYADSFAIASGGATFYRNRINDLVKNQGMSEADAKKQAMSEWRETAEISQQSSDPSKISAQQASDLGRVILAFANTPMQYARIQKRALQDIVNGRGDAKTNASKIIYYAVVQNLIFNALQSALFSLGFGDDEDDEKKEKMYLRTANGMLDSQLRGLGVAGATVSVIKNFLTDIYERSGRKRPEYVDSIYKLLQISPPVSSKISKIRGAAWQFDSKKRREEIFEKGFSIDNPAYEAGAKVISATTNIPLDRVYSKIDNISGAMDEDAETWQTVAMLSGWPKWSIMPKEKEVSTFSKGNVKVKKSKYKKKSSKSRFSKR